MELSVYALPGIGSRFKRPLLNVGDFESMLKVICEITGVNPRDVKSKKRFREIKDARHLFCLIARKHTNETLGTIGRFIGGRDHTTVLHAIGAVNKLIDTEPAMKSVLEFIEKEIYRASKSHVDRLVYLAINNVKKYKHCG